MSSAGKNGAAVQAHLVELTPIEARPATGAALLGNKLGLLDSVPVTLSVVVGEARTTVGELMALRELSVLKIDKEADCPVDVIVNGNVVARGQLVVVDDNFGVRISEVAQSGAQA